jgi:hypothetical protein
VWVEVSTNSAGLDDSVWLTTLIQNLKLVYGESPFFGDWGIPAQQSVVQQVFPDFYVALTQQRFAGYFAALTVAKLNGRTPHYRINATTQQGFRFQEDVPVAE